MAILHGTWSMAGEFFLWGETWRKVEPQPYDPANPLPAHPLALTLGELERDLGSWLPPMTAPKTKGRSSEPTPPPVRPSTWLLALPTTLDFPHDSQGIPPQDPAPKRASRKTSARKTSAQGNDETIAPDPIAPLPTPHSPLPTPPILLTPHHSASPLSDAAPLLFPWQVQGLVLSPAQALPWLTGLPLTSSGSGEDDPLGGDLRFWSHRARWVLDLLCRGKFLPQLLPQLLPQSLPLERDRPEPTDLGNGTPEPGSEATPRLFQSYWRGVLDSASDRHYLERSLAQMPQICAFAHPPSPTITAPALPHPTPPRQLVQHFLHSLIHHQVRSQTPTPKALELDPTVATWLQGLGTTPPRSSDPEALSRLAANLERWAVPLATTQTQFRTCFMLEPPPSDRPQDPWLLGYGLQADDDPQFQVKAAEIWQNPVETWVHRGRVLKNPQETLLLGLGLAVRLYPTLEASLDSPSPCHCPLNASEAYHFIKAVAWRLEDHGLSVVLPPSLRGETLANRLGLSIRASLPKKQMNLGLQGLLQFQWELSLGGQTFSKAAFEQLVAQNSPLVQVNGEWLELRPQDIKAAREFFSRRQEQPNLSLEDALRIASGDAQSFSKLPVVDFEAAGALQDLVTTLSGQQTPQPLAAPPSFQGQLRPYQERGAGWLAFLQQWNLGACLADDMGLGKTIQLITLLLHLKTQGQLTQPVLLVCPTSVLGNWEREVRKFAPDLRVSAHHGDSRSKGKALLSWVQGQDLILTSYALVYRDLKELLGVPWQGIVLDEAQNIKNAESKQSQAVRQLAQTPSPSSQEATPLPRFRIALTGTPVENRLGELWAIMDFLNPGYLGPRNFFQRRFAIPIERYGDTASLTGLRSLVQPFILRRLKSDRTIIQDLPEKQEMAVFCGLSSEQAQLYQTVVDQTLAAIEAAQGIQRHGLVLALLTKLKQVCNHPALLLKEDNPDALVPESFRPRSAKLQRLGEMIEEVEAEGDRALIFTQFAEWGKWLKIYLEKQRGQEVFFLAGSTPKAKREEMVDRFQQDPQAPRLMILSLKAGGVGLNLTRANHVFHYDRWWNPAVENQATDRAFRIGQTRNVQVHKFVCQGTLEERIHELMATKQELAQQVVGDGENWLGNLDTAQLRDLLLLDRNAIIEDP